MVAIEANRCNAAQQGDGRVMVNNVVLGQSINPAHSSTISGENQTPSEKTADDAGNNRAKSNEPSHSQKTSAEKEKSFMEKGKTP